MTLKHFDEQNPNILYFEQCWLLLRRSNVDTLLDQAATLANPHGGTAPRNPYTATSILMAVMVTVAHRGQVGLSQMFRHLWHMTDEQLDRVGMAQHITVGRRRLIAEDYDEYVKEYNQFRHRFDQLADTIDSSPHPRGVREKNSVRWQRVKSLSDDLREVLDKKEELFTEVVDRLTRASLVDADRSTWEGHVTLDETLVPAYASHLGCGPGMNSMGVADPDAAWYPDKKYKGAGGNRINDDGTKTKARPDFLDVWHMFVITVPAVSPYAPEADNLAVGIRVKMPKGEPNTMAAVNSIKAAWRAGFAKPSGNRRLRVITDEGYTHEDRFAYEMHQLGYYTLVNANQPIPKYEGNKTTKLSSGYEIKHGGLVCPAGKHISRTPLGWPPNVRTNPAFAIEERQDVVDEIARYTAPTNGRPKLVNVFNGDTKKWEEKIAIRVTCPAAAGQVQCKIFDAFVDSTSSIPIAANPPTGKLPPSCLTANTTVHMEPKMIKHLDDMIRGSFEHNDWFNYNRTHTEKHFAQAKAVANGALNGKRITVMGRARVGLIVTIALTLENMRRIESREKWHATNTHRHLAKKNYSRLDRGPAKYKHTPREANRKLREKILNTARRLRRPRK